MSFLLGASLFGSNYINHSILEYPYFWKHPLHPICLYLDHPQMREKIQRFFEVPLRPPKKSVQHPSLRTRLGLYWCLPPHLFTANPTPPPFSTARVLKLAEPGAMAPGSCCCGCSAFGGSFSLANRNWNTHNQFWVEVNWKRYDAWYRHSPQL